jgi:hypothetical protein
VFEIGTQVVFTQFEPAGHLDDKGIHFPSNSYSSILHFDPFIGLQVKFYQIIPVGHKLVI